MASDDWAADIFSRLEAAEVAQAAYVPDAGHKRLIQLSRNDGAITAVPLTTEEEGIAQLAGAWLGGKRGVLLMQSSGLGNCVNMLAMTRTCRFPLLMLITMRGEAGEFNPWQEPMGRSAAALLELAGARVFRVDKAEQAGETVAAAAHQAFGDDAMVAVLIAQALVGVKTFEQ